MRYRGVVSPQLFSLRLKKQQSRNRKSDMASITMTASFTDATNMLKQPSSTPTRHGVVMVKAMKSSEIDNAAKEDTSSKRRDLVFAAAAAAACSLAKVAIAEEPKRGTAEAKKKYAPVCVTMPSAKICYK